MSQQASLRLPLIMKKDIKILFLSPCPFIPHQGGVERITDTLTKSFQKLGSIRVRYLWTQELDPQLPYDFPAPYDVFAEDPVQFEQYLKEHQIDIVINQAGAGKELQSYYPVSHKLGVAMIPVFHVPSLTSDIDVPRLFLERWQDAQKPWRARLHNALLALFYYSGGKFLYRHMWRKRYQLVYAYSDAVCLLSLGYTQNLRRIYDEKKDGLPNKYRAIANANTYPKQNIDLNTKKKQILFVGRFTSQKNVFDLLKIWHKLHKDWPDWQLILVGEGEDKAAAQTFAQKHLLQNIFFAGLQNPKKYYEEASILCLTSRFEGFGLVLCEAMVHGCIPTAYNSYSAVYDIIDDNTNGLIIRKGNIKEYASRLASLMGDKEAREQMAKKTMRKAEQFDQSHITQQWMQLIHELLPTRG